MATAVVDGTTYLFVAAGNDGVSVFSVSAGVYAHQCAKYQR